MFFDWSSIQRFYKFLQRNVSSSDDSLDRSMCMIPHQRLLKFWPSFHILPLKAFEWSFWVGMKVGHTCIIYFAKSKTRPQGDASHTLWSRRVSMWNFYKVLFLNIFGTPWIMTLSLLDECLFIWKYGLSLFFYFFFFSFLHALWHVFFSFMPFGMDIFLA